MTNLYIYSLAGLIGLVIGSFLNVVISRLPVIVNARNNDKQEEDETRDVRFNLWVPRSRCDSCLTPIRYRDLIPVLSWVLLKGRCRNCSARISWRYPIVETLGCLFAILLVGHFAVTDALGCAAICMALLIALSAIDIEHGILPDELNYVLLWSGLLTSIYFEHSNVFPSPSEAIIGAIAGYLSFWLINFLFRIVRNRDGLGQGDFKLLAAIGAWVGWHLLSIVVLIALVLGFVYGLVRILQKRYSRDEGIPFGPSLCMGCVCVVIYRQELFNFVFERSWLG
ncbi:MAG: prepilin peptidase [Gammaproteobacteria bacterium]|nr:prepilin peptidase [Gammaproteobacteria bacterium]MYI76961.1 prepilin peptidase [Gammaproteobacteria bacterium]